MHQAVTKGGAVSWLLLVVDKEDNVEEVCGDQGKVEAKDCCPANLEEESCPLCFSSLPWEKNTKSMEMGVTWVFM